MKNKDKQLGLVSRPPVVVVLGHVDHGKCVAPETLVPLVNGEILDMKEIWGKYNKKLNSTYIKENDKEGWIIQPKGLKVFSFNGEKTIARSVSHIWKLKAPSHLIKINLNSGDEITVTPEHPFFVFTPEGIIQERRADLLDKNDFILVPQVLKFRGSISVIKKRILQRLEYSKNLVVFLTENKEKKFFEKLRQVNKQELYRKGLFSTYPNYNFNKRYLRAHDFVKIGRFLGFSYEELYEMIDYIKNATEKWRAGKTSNKIKWPRLPLNLEKLGYIAGCLAGDGQTSNAILHNNDPIIQKVFQTYLKEVFGVSSKIEKTRTCDVIVNSGYKTITRYLVDILDFPYKEKSRDISFPSVFVGSPEFISGFIAGWFDTDGYFSSINNSLEFTSKSKKLIKLVSFLLLSFGIHSVVFNKKTKLPSKAKKTTYYLRIANKPYLEKFLQTFPIQHLMKKKKIQKGISKTSTSRIFDLTPISGENLFSFYVDESALPYFSRYRTYKFLSRHFLEKLFIEQRKNKFPQIFSHPALKHLINPGEISCVKVREKKVVRNRKYKFVYDLTVPDFHNFVGERMFLHNTSLLDYIRKTKVAEKEAGEITQHIGAYEIEIKDKKITFIDTPGHEAFFKIRSRGVKVADIAILVVAVDEGVKPQTKESFKIIQEENIPFIVAITKIDKSANNLERIKNELAEEGILLEGRGGDVPCVGVSSKNGQGIDDLLELIILLSEMQELKADSNKPASGVVIESHLDHLRGNAADLIILDGTLRVKDKIVAGESVGKIKILENFQGKPIKEATFSSPVRVVGFESLVPAGEQFFAGKKDIQITESSQKMVNVIKKLGQKDSEIKIPLIIKTDAFGSGEALEEVINKLGKEKKWLFLLFKNETGDISESDFKVISSGQVLVIGFRVKKKPEINNLLLINKDLILIEGDVIYEITDKIEEVVKKRFIEKPTEEIIGELEVLAIFNPVKGNQLIGGKVIEGKVQNKNNFRLIRDEKIIGQGKILNLQKNRIEVLESKVGEECGLLISSSKEVKTGDKLVFFKKI